LASAIILGFAGIFNRGNNLRVIARSPDLPARRGNLMPHLEIASADFVSLATTERGSHFECLPPLCYCERSVAIPTARFQILAPKFQADSTVEIPSFKTFSSFVILNFGIV
jgi:hypothetical protein